MQFHKQMAIWVYLVQCKCQNWKRRAQRTLMGKVSFGAIKWLPLIPGSSSATERYPNFLLSYFMPLARGPWKFHSGAHAAFPVASRSVSESVWMSSLSHYRKQHHTRHRKRYGFCGSTGVVSERGEASSPVAVPASLVTAWEESSTNSAIILNRWTQSWSL